MFKVSASGLGCCLLFNFLIDVNSYAELVVAFVLKVGLGDVYLEVLLLVLVATTVHFLPIDVGKELVILDILDTIPRSQSLPWILVQKPFDQVKCITGPNLEVGKLCRNDVLMHLIFIIVEEWRQTSQHLMKKHSQTVEVKCAAVPLIQQNLRGVVLWTSTESDCLIILMEVLLGQSEVCQLEITPLVDKDILRLQIPVEYVVLMKMIDGKHNLCEQYLCLGNGELPVSLD